MTEAFHQYTKDKEETGKKLDWVFEEVATKVREQESFRKEPAERHQGVTRTINDLFQLSPSSLGRSAQRCRSTNFALISPNRLK